MTIEKSVHIYAYISYFTEDIKWTVITHKIQGDMKTTLLICKILIIAYISGMLLYSTVLCYNDVILRALGRLYTYMSI